MNRRSYLFLCLFGTALAAATGCSTMTSQSSKPGDSLTSSKSSDLTSPKAQSPSGSVDGSKSELSVPDHPSVESWVRQYSGQRQRSFQTLLDRASLYAVPAKEVFASYGLPKDLIYVALVESGFTPKARSHAKAVGMWQFIPETGKRFGLEQNRWVDERCHPMKAARAAAEYLSSLYDMFGSWPLALAAYNAGENAVQRVLDQSGHKTFWELEADGYLPAETRDYVPKVLATVKITRSPAQYGFHYDPQRPVPKHATVPVPGGVKLSWVGKKIGISEASLQNCNPELCQPVTPPGCTSYDLCLPEAQESGVLAAMVARALEEEPPDKKAAADLPEAPASKLRTKSGDTWARLAARAKSSPKTVAALNAASPSKPPKAGQTIKVPGASLVMVAAATSTKDSRKETPAAKAGAKKAQSAASGPKSAGSLTNPAKSGKGAGAVPEKPRVPLKSQAVKSDPKPGPKAAAGPPLRIAANSQRNADGSAKKTAKK